MVGLSVILESQKRDSAKNPVIRKSTVITMNNASSSSKNSGLQTAPFLHSCYLCKQKLLPGRDIYMYKGDRGFCSVECRCRQIFMDEEECVLKDNCSLAAMNAKTSSTSSSSSGSGSASSSSSSATASRNRKSTRNRRGEFVY